MRSKIVGAVLAVAVLSGCVAEDPTVFFIKNALSLTRKQQCVVKAGGAAQEVISIGLMDLLLTRHYVIFPIVVNQLPVRTNSSAAGNLVMGLDASTITIAGAWLNFHMEGLTVQYDPLNPTSEVPTDFPSDFFVPTSGSVAGGGDAESVVGFHAVPGPVGDLLDNDRAFDHQYSGGLLNVEIVLQGFLADNTEVHSSPFFFPIMVCRGCSPAYEQVGSPSECCPSMKEATYQACFPGQDEATSCLVACGLIQENDHRGREKMAMLLGYVDSLDEALSPEVNVALDAAFAVWSPVAPPIEPEE